MALWRRSFGFQTTLVEYLTRLPRPIWHCLLRPKIPTISQTKTKVHHFSAFSYTVAFIIVWFNKNRLDLGLVYVPHLCTLSLCFESASTSYSISTRSRLLLRDFFDFVSPPFTCTFRRFTLGGPLISCSGEVWINGTIKITGLSLQSR